VTKCPVCGREFEDSEGGGKGARLAIHKLSLHLNNSKDEAHLAYRGVEVPVAPESTSNRASATPYEPTPETKPAAQTPAPAIPERPRKWWQRKAKPGTSIDGHPKERSPRRIGATGGRRLPAADFLGEAYEGLGTIVGQMTPYQATSRAIAFNAPIAGYQLDKVVQGTVVDRMVVQPGVRMQEKYRSVSMLIEFPIIIMLIEAEMLKPEPNLGKVAFLVGRLRGVIRKGLPAMAPAIKKKREDDQKLAEAVKELYPELPEGEDPVDAVLASLGITFDFSVPQPEEAPA
jgi:hypothetical protein